MGYESEWRVVNASDYGVPQLRPRAILVAMKKEVMPFFSWPKPRQVIPPTVGEALYDEMRANGWLLAERWREAANSIAPTLVGGSKKHGGADLGPTRARQAWALLGVDGRGLANYPPMADEQGMPKLTLAMTAIIQGFPKNWQITGKKTPAYRQVGNAFPPPVAAAVGKAIVAAFDAYSLIFPDSMTSEWQKQKKEPVLKQN